MPSVPRIHFWSNGGERIVITLSMASTDIYMCYVLFYHCFPKTAELMPLFSNFVTDAINN